MSNEQLIKQLECHGMLSTFGEWSLYSKAARALKQLLEENERNQLDNASLAHQRDELLAALIECDEAMGYMSEYDIPIGLPDRVKSAIASVKGGAA